MITTMVGEVTAGHTVHDGAREVFGDEAARWAAVVDRDRTADGHFYYSVRTTGVYCRPSCPSRRARRARVRFHGTTAEAKRAGFRPCKRCRPDERSLEARRAALVTEACRVIERATRPPTLRALADAAGMSRFQFQRDVLCERVGGARHDADALSHRGTGALMRFAVGQCWLGAVLVAATETGVCAIFLGDDPDTLLQELHDRFPKAQLVGGDQDFEAYIAKVVGLVEAPGLGLELPLDIRGTAFQQRVWQALRDIPVGATASYTDIARRIGAPNAVRGVAGACAANPIAVAIPCHRVVRRDGALSGYRWGIERKRALLTREGVR
jgi:AraC family transcriptional regulator of adaptative response/methylated-DNA-[protein]-cysteine methyltransferase